MFGDMHKGSRAAQVSRGGRNCRRSILEQFGLRYCAGGWRCCIIRSPLRASIYLPPISDMCYSDRSVLPSGERPIAIGFSMAGTTNELVPVGKRR